MEILSILKTAVIDIFLTIFLFLVFYFLAESFFKSLKIKIERFHVLYVYPIVGVLLFALLSYVLSWLHLSFLMLVVVLGVLLIHFKKNSFHLPKIEKEHRHSLLIVSVLALIFSWSMLGMGVYGHTIAYRGEDPVHLAYINELKAHFPPDNPGFAGIPLKGYHFLYQFIMAMISNVFRLPVASLYFHVFPLIVSFTWGVGAYGVMFLWSKKKDAGLWAVFLSFFGGSAGFILYLLGHNKASIDSVFGIVQPTVALINPQFAFSVPIVLTAFYFIHSYFKKKSMRLLIPLVLCVGLTPLVKIYAGVILYVPFLFLVFTDILRLRFKTVLALIFSFVLSYLTIGLFLGQGQRLIWDPLWPPHTVLTDNLPWYGYTEKSYTYTRLGVIHGILEIESFGLLIYFVGNIGTRIIGMLIAFLVFVVKRKRPSLFSLSLLAATLVSVLIPLFFIQTGKVFESIQFAWYYPIFCSFFAALGFSYFFNLRFPKILKIFLILCIVIASLPPAYDHFTNSALPDTLKIRQNLSDPYFTAMDFLKKQGNYNDTVLEIPIATIRPQDISYWFLNSSPHVSAFANKRTYLNYEFILFDNVNPKTRFGLLSDVIRFGKVEKIGKNKLIKELKKAGIVYFYSFRVLPALQNEGVVKKLYGNSSALIYKVVD